MNRDLMKRRAIFYKCVAAFVLYIAFALGFHLGGWTNEKLKQDKEAFKDGLLLAVSLAQDAYDSKYGNDAFLYGVRRIVRDGDKEFYGFFVAKNGTNDGADTLVEVDLTGRTAKTILHNNIIEK